MMKNNRNKKNLQRSRERANLSFFIVVMFFAVFGIIVLTEIFLIDERGRGAGVLVRHGGQGGRNRNFGDQPDYEDQSLLQGEDYLLYHSAGLEENNGIFIREERALPRELNGKYHKLNAEKQQLGNFFPMPLQREKIHAIPEGHVEHIPPNNIPAAVESKLPGVKLNHSAKDGTWQIVSGTRYKFFVYSAFFDQREEKIVRIIGATKTRAPERVWCRMWYNISLGNGSTVSQSVSVQAKIKAIRENWNLKYSACFILCPLRRNLSAPVTVSVVSRLRNNPSNHLLVRNTDQDPEIKIKNSKDIPNKLAVCVKPFHFNYNLALQMLGFLELHSLLGVSHFTFYNHTVSPTVGCILEDYISRGLVTLLPWQLNMVSQKEIRTEGLFAALNDCLYRSMYRYSHVALIDLDEYIIPRHNNTILDLITWMGNRVNLRHTGSYSFQNAFFYLQWKDDDSVIDNSDPFEAGLITLRKTRRRSKLHPHKQRSKYICRPEFVIEAGNHFVWEFVPGHGTFNIPPDAAILHHYRVCEFGGNDCIKTASIIDRTAYRYKKNLVERVRDKWLELKSTCDLPEIPVETVTSDSISVDKSPKILPKNVQAKHR